MAPQTETTTNPNWSWPYWPLVPIYPYGQRRTRRAEVVPGEMWVFEQVQGIFYVVVPVRMTVVKLAAGGLLVYAPVAPTQECLQLLQELIDQHGTVKHIILSTISGIEHKVPAIPFARKFKEAQVWASPGHWSFPVNLPLSLLGFPQRRTQVLPTNSRETPFADEFDYAILGPLNLGLGKFGETVFFHRRSRTLLATDTVLAIPERPPEVVQLDPYPLLFHAKDEPTDEIRDRPDLRIKGWQRICLFALYFRPSTLETIDLPIALNAAKAAPDRSRKAYWGLYPFAWSPHWRASFKALRKDGQLLVAPILQNLILNRNIQAVLQWRDRVSSWEFEQIIPCHFSAPIPCQPAQFSQAFSFLQERETNQLTVKDTQVLQEIDAQLVKLNVTPAPETQQT